MSRPLTGTQTWFSRMSRRYVVYGQSTLSSCTACPFSHAFLISAVPTPAPAPCPYPCPCPCHGSDVDRDSQGKEQEASQRESIVVPPSSGTSSSTTLLAAPCSLTRFFSLCLSHSLTNLQKDRFISKMFLRGDSVVLGKHYTRCNSRARPNSAHGKRERAQAKPHHPLSLSLSHTVLRNTA